MCRFTVIGISDSHKADFDLSLLAGATAFSGGRRHHDIMSSSLPEGAVWIDIAPPLSKVFDAYRRIGGDIVVFASGDPLFYGFASTLKREFPGSEIKVIPHFNSLQTLAHRLVMSYEDMRAVSLTGRPWRELDNALIRREKMIGVLTDRTHTPLAIAARMLDYGYTDYHMYAGENLGNDKLEKISSLSLNEAVERQWQMPNCVILKSEAPKARQLFISEKNFDHLNGRENMIPRLPSGLSPSPCLTLAIAARCGT